MTTPGGPSRQKRLLFTGFGVFLLFVLAFAILFFVSFRTVEVEGPSMEPTLHTGQRVLVSNAYWLVGDISKGDIVVLRSPKTNEIIIKRVYALPGQLVDFLNIPRTWSLSQGEFRVPPGTVYVLGDNKPASEDSRELGPIPADRIIGKVVVLNSST